MKINIDEIIEQIKAMGLVPVRVIYAHAPKTEMLVSGDLNYFLQSVKALDEKAVFISEIVFNESYFMYQPESEILGVYGTGDQLASVGEINLLDVKPELKEYKQYEGETAFLKFMSFYQGKSVNYFQNAEWYTNFEQLEDEATEIVDMNEKKLKIERETRQATVIKENQKQEAALVEKLKTLLMDEKFCRLPTQRAMQVYALEAIPELEELPPFMLKNEIQLLSDRIKAKKLLD